MLEIVDVSANSNKKIKYENLFGTPSAGGWNDLNDIPDTVTANGNRSYDLVFNSNDLTDTVSPGMRLQLTRTVTAPTQCTDLESGSSQYWNKTSPTGISFTDDFTIMAWVKLESYDTNAANIRTILSRRNAAVSGFGFAVRANGQVTIYGGGASAFDVASTYNSIPIGRWVHVAGTLDMSGTTATIYIDGISQTIGYTNSGATAVTQSGDLIVGSVSGSSEFFDGKIAQVRLFDAVLTQATIRSYMSQTLSGSETNCIGAWTFNGNGNDSDANANNLTAQAAATATSADTPFAGGSVGTTEYGIVTKTAFSTNTTLTVQVPEGYAIPTSGGVSAVLYSTHKAPYAFPTDANKWTIIFLDVTDEAQASPVNGTWYNFTGAGLTVPVGSWTVGYEVVAYITKAAATDIRLKTTLSTATNSESDIEMTGGGYIGGASGTLINANTVTKERELTMSSATPYYLLLQSVANSALNLVAEGALGPTKIRAKCAYL